MIEVEGRPGIVLEFVEGQTMWSRMREHPNELPALVELLVDLQCQLHDAGPVDGVPDLATRLRNKIAQAQQLSARDRDKAWSLLADLPRGSALCHGDMHPANIVLATHGPVILDWFDAGIGRAHADRARSSLLMRPPLTGTSGSHLDGATPGRLGQLHGTYLSALRRKGLLASEEFEAWEAVIAVARMSEPVPKADLLAIWQHWLAGSSVPRSEAALPEAEHGRSASR